MQVEELFNLFLITSALTGIGFSIRLFFSKNGRDKSMIYLNLMLLSIALNNLQSWILAKQLFQHKFMLDYMQIPWHFLTAPFFYMFLVHYLEILDKAVKILKTVIPVFCIAVIAQVSFVIIFSKNGATSNLDLIYERYTTTEEIVSFIISIGVFGYSFYVLYKKEKLFPKILSFDNLRWIYNFFILGAVVYFLWISALLVKIGMNFSGFIFSYYPLRIATTLLIFWVGYQSLLQLNLLKERRRLRYALSTKKTNSENTATAINQKNEEFDNIHAYVIENKKFTEIKLTREALAEELGMSKSKFSSIINSGANKSFIDFMNELRVNQAKDLLTHKDYQQYTITAVGLESGFNSKSTFYTAFKKHTGKTPAEFRTENS